MSDMLGNEVAVEELPPIKTPTGMKVEPVMIMNIIKTGLQLAIAFGVAIAPAQEKGIMEFAAAIIAVIAIQLGGDVITRTLVVSPATNEREKAAAYAAGKAAAKR